MSARPSPAPAADDVPLGPIEQERFEALRELRRTLAAEHNVPPYVIFHDRTLKEMALTPPTTPSEMLAINGVGQAKLDRYGEAFLALLR
jgi:ATP-dependent DNA helicase RecQ